MQYLGCSAFLWATRLGASVTRHKCLWEHGYLDGNFAWKIYEVRERERRTQGCYLGCRMLLFKRCFRRWQHSRWKLRPWIAKMLSPRELLVPDDDLNIMALCPGTDGLAVQGCKVSNMVTADSPVLHYECHGKPAGSCSAGLCGRM